MPSPSHNSSAGQDWKPGVSPWLIASAVMLATFMEVLDTSIASVTLPHIAGSLSASTSEATWVLTSYLVANAVILPSSSWFAQRFGRKNFLLVCIVIFTISSFLCGAATSLGWILIARTIQGAGGGALQPISQAILLERFPPEKRGSAMAVFALGVVVAPVLGPTLGGWLTDQYSWRWAFYINVPVGILAVLMISRFIEDPDRRHLDHRQFQGNATQKNAPRPARRCERRHFFQKISRLRAEHARRYRRSHQPASARKRHRQLREGGATAARADPLERGGKSRPVASTGNVR